ncbi:MAG TPA: hypothetical protein VMT57_02370 [Candidatus Thermoplasmatota archaeon]|nr:hypothetical protein [Candidatus Thermoplasmatota archaeon]
MICISMSGFAISVVSSAQKLQPSDQINPSAIGKTNTMDQLKKSIYNYLNIQDNIHPDQEQNTNPIIVPWIQSTSDTFEWWISITYNNHTFQKQLNISIKDFQQKFLKHPYYCEDVSFNLDSDPEDDLKVSFGFYWETILNTKTNVEYKSLEDMVRVRQINGGPSDPFASLEVWSEIHVNWGLVKTLSADDILLPFNTHLSVSTHQVSQTIKPLSFLIQMLQRRAQENSMRTGILHRIWDRMRSHQRSQASSMQQSSDPQDLTANNDYFAVGVGYRTVPGGRIPQYVEKRFAFAKDSLFSPVIFQQVMKTEPSGVDPLELLYGFRAYNGSTNTLKYDIAFSVEFSPFVTLTTQFIPLGGYVYYHFDTESQHDSTTTITYSTDINTGSGDSTSLSLVFDKIDGTMAQTGQWMSFGLHKDPHGFDYEASNSFDVAVIVDSPFFSQKVKINGLPQTLSYQWKIFDDFNITFVHGKLFYVNVCGYADLTMSSQIGKITVYYPKLTNPDEQDVPFLQAENIPSSRRLEAQATLTIQNDSMLQVDASGYVDLTKSGPLGAITVYYPKANPSDSNVVLMKVPAGSINSQRVSAEATLYVDPDNFSNINNYVYGKIERQADSDFNEMDFYLPNISIPIVQITDIPANAYATGTFWWNQLKGSGRAERSSASQNPDPLHFNIVFDTLTLSDVLSIGSGHIQTDFLMGKNGYFQFDTSHDVLGNSFSVGNTATGNSLLIDATSVSAQDFAVNWGLDTSGPQPQIQALDLSGTLNALRNFTVGLQVNHKNISFTGDWSLGESGGLSVDVQQTNDIYLNFIHLDNISGRLDINGYVVLSSTLHFDIGWKWKQGSSYDDPGYFRINQNTNQPNLKTINLNCTYRDENGVPRWGANVTLSNFAVYICVEWYWQNQFFIWPVISVSGNLVVNLLLDYNWYHVWP